MEKVRKTHARKPDGSPFSCWDVCCRVSTGTHLCCYTSKQCDIEKFGIGMAVYFRFVKHLIFYFILYSIFAVPSIYFSSKGKGFTTYSLSYNRISEPRVRK